MTVFPLGNGCRLWFNFPNGLSRSGTRASQLTPITPAEFARRMASIKDEPDPEQAHVVADCLLLETLRSLGYGVGCDSFEEIDKWYS